MDDRELIRRASSGDETAEFELFRAYFARIHRLIFRMTGDPALADDLTQDTFVRAFDRLSTFRGEARFSTWLTRIAVTVALNELKRQSAERARWLPLPDDLADAPSTPPQPFLMDRVERALETLSDHSRGVLAMYVEGYSHEEIASAFGISVAASKTRLSRARASLRETLSDVLDEQWR